MSRDTLVLECSCFACGTARGYQSELFVAGDVRLTIPEAQKACSCGETRIRVTLDPDPIANFDGSVE